METTPEGTRRKGKHRKKVSDSEILSIVYRVLVEKEMIVDVARAFRISAGRVSNLVKQISKDRTALEAMQQKNFLKENREAVLKQQILMMLVMR